MKRNAFAAGLLVAMSLVAATSVAADVQNYVLPTVAAGVPGFHGSYWDTEVRSARFSVKEPVTVRRTWVAREGGGAVDPVDTAPRWVMPAQEGASADKLLILTGAQLLEGTGAVRGSVALEVEGRAEVWIREANTLEQDRLPSTQSGPPQPAPKPCCLPGNSHATRALTTPLVGASLIPWLSSGNDVFRSNIGVVNTSDRTLRLTIEILSLSADTTGATWGRGTTALEPIEVTLPPLGWRQLNDVFRTTRVRCPFPACDPFVTWVTPGVAVITPDAEATPYFAYAAVVYSPTNDSMIVPATTGTVDLPWP
jgi:hypothetical protein